MTTATLTMKFSDSSHHLAVTILERRIVHLYRGTATALANEIAAGTLVPQLRQRFAERMLYAPTESEVTRWERAAYTGLQTTGAPPLPSVRDPHGRPSYGKRTIRLLPL